MHFSLYDQANVNDNQVLNKNMQNEKVIIFFFDNNNHDEKYSILKNWSIKTKTCFKNNKLTR